MVRWHWRTQSRQGQAIVETALFSLLALYILIGVVDVGRMLYTYITVTQAAKDGARKGVAYPNCRKTITNFASVTTASQNTTYNSIDYAVAQAGQQLGLGSSHITVAYYTYNPTTGARTTASSGTTGGQIDVTVTYPFTPIIPLASTVIGSVTVVGKATHLIELGAAGC